MSISKVVQTGGFGLGLPVEDIDVFVWNRNPESAASSATVLPGQVVAFTIADQALISGDDQTIAIGHSRYGNIFGNVTMEYAAGSRKGALCGVALDTLLPCTADGGQRGGRVRVRGVVQAYVRTSTATSIDRGYALVLDETAKGYLDGPTQIDPTSGTAKIMALALETQAATTSNTDFTSTQLKYVLFDGLNGFGGTNGQLNL